MENPHTHTNFQKNLIEKCEKFREVLGRFQNELLKKDYEKFSRFQTDLEGRVNYLIKKYKRSNAEKYAMFHVLCASSVNPEIGVTHDDFPDEDSVGIFLNNLMEQYK